MKPFAFSSVLSASNNEFILTEKGNYFALR